jgi:hypothetical protein
LEDHFLDSEIFDVFNSKSAKEKEEETIDLLNQEKILKEYYDKLNALPYDSKSAKLIELIDEIYSQNPREKIIIFTQFVDTLKFLKSLLESHNTNFDIELFFGGLDKIQKDESVERFRSSKKFSILISTEIGGEGRNFQFCRVLINYDLPWNPMKLEQRIGRLDRIGQKSKEIYIYNIFMEGTVETDIIHAIIKRINLFEESIGILEPIIGRIEKDFKGVIFAEEDGKKRKRLNEFYRTLDEEIRKAKEIEMQLDDLMIDKKSFQMEGLITSLASCVDVKLTHNELYLLMKLFFDNLDHLYGNLVNIQDPNIEASNDFNFTSRIILNDNLIKNPKYQFQNEYIGTFSLDLARKKEEIDFFALGHPMINSLIDFCLADDFKGNLSLLFISRTSLEKFYNHKSIQEKELFLFIFSVKFQGYIIESQISAIVVDKDGIEIEHFADTILDIKNINEIFLLNKKSETLDLDYNLINNLQGEAKNIVKLKTSIWKREIKVLNDIIFDQEKKKKEKIYSHKRRALNLKLESVAKNLEQKENKRPTARQLHNIEKISDPERKKERIGYYKKLEEDIEFLNKGIKSTKKKLDDLLFEYEDLKNEMSKRNKSKFYTNLISFAVLKIVD